MSEQRTRVVVADDDRVVRDALADLVASQPDLDLVGAAVDHPDAIRLTIHHRPHALVLDARMPRGTAAATVRAIRDRAPDVGILVLSAYGDPAGAVEVLAAGASGYLVKGVADQEVLEGVARAARGQLSISVPFARECIQLLRRHPERGSRTEPAGAGPRYERLFETSPEATVVVDAAGAIQLVNAATERLFGYPREELVGQTVDALLPDHPVTIYRRESDEVPAEPGAPVTPVGLELVGRRRDGTEFPVDLSISRIPTEEGLQVMLTGRDMTEIAGSRAVLEHSIEVLRAAGQEHRNVLVDLVRAQERERMRIAAGIHDDSLQVITAASLRLQQLRRRLGDPDDLKAVSKVEETVKLAADRLRRMIFNFRPPALEEEGLVTALQVYLDQLQDDTNMSYRLDSHLDEEPPLETRVVLYRIAQEALMNVRKHARASRVGVQLSVVDDGCLVEIVDDGVGYYPQRTEARPGHLGLTLMRDRAEIAGGWCRVESAPGAGTTVEYWIPCELAVATSDGPLRGGETP